MYIVQIKAIILYQWMYKEREDKHAGKKQKEYILDSTRIYWTCIFVTDVEKIITNNRISRDKLLQYHDIARKSLWMSVCVTEIGRYISMIDSRLIHADKWRCCVL